MSVIDRWRDNMKPVFTEHGVMRLVPKNNPPTNPTPPCAYCRAREGMVTTLLLVGGLGWALAFVMAILLCVQKGILE